MFSDIIRPKTFLAALVIDQVLDDDEGAIGRQRIVGRRDELEFSLQGDYSAAGQVVFKRYAGD